MRQWDWPTAENAEMNRHTCWYLVLMCGFVTSRQDALAQANGDSLSMREKGSALSSVMHARTATLRDSTRFNTCHVARFLGGGQDALLAIRAIDRQFVIASRGDPCSDQSGRSSGILPIEVKATSTPPVGDTAGLRAFLDDYADLAVGGLLLHGGREALHLCCP